MILDKKQMTEEDIKLQYITPAIQTKWGLDRITMETKITDGRINLKGNIVIREKPKKADYVLYLNKNKPIAIVEAKDNNHSVSYGLQQAITYAQMQDKFLIFKEKGEYECGHHLLSLFNQLTEPHRTVLTERICKEAHQNETTLTENLNNISNLFEDFRYFYEHEILGYSNFLNDFIHIVCDYAISMKSEYEES